ncbi:MAG: hypothetical protein KIT16_00765 [Rhodospirillaceae bacterium]|nr:hypothetical protein [Rhodospirillaceae bacterium]
MEPNFSRSAVYYPIAEFIRPRLAFASIARALAVSRVGAELLYARTRAFRGGEDSAGYAEPVPRSGGISSGLHSFGAGFHGKPLRIASTIRLAARLFSTAESAAMTL